MLGTRKYPPAEPGALGIEPLKAAEFGAAEAAPRWWLGRVCSSFVPLHLGRTSTRIASWTWDLGQAPKVYPPDASSYNALYRSMRSPLVCLAAHNWKLRRWVDFRKCQTATATPAEPGGLPVMLGAGTGAYPRAGPDKNRALRLRQAVNGLWLSVADWDAAELYCSALCYPVSEKKIER